MDHWLDGLNRTDDGDDLDRADGGAEGGGSGEDDFGIGGVSPKDTAMMEPSPAEAGAAGLNGGDGFDPYDLYPDLAPGEETRPWGGLALGDEPRFPWPRHQSGWEYRPGHIDWATWAKARSWGQGRNPLAAADLGPDAIPLTAAGDGPDAMPLASADAAAPAEPTSPAEPTPATASEPTTAPTTAPTTDEAPAPTPAPESQPDPAAPPVDGQATTPAETPTNTSPGQAADQTADQAESGEKKAGPTNGNLGLGGGSVGGIFGGGTAPVGPTAEGKAPAGNATQGGNATKTGNATKGGDAKAGNATVGNATKGQPKQEEKIVTPYEGQKIDVSKVTVDKTVDRPVRKEVTDGLKQFQKDTNGKYELGISSTYRTPAEDITAGGSGKGPHTTGNAVDINRVNGKSPLDMTEKEQGAITEELKKVPGVKKVWGPNGLLDRNDQGGWGNSTVGTPAQQKRHMNHWHLGF